jgi:hypothetical protein
MITTATLVCLSLASAPVGPERDPDVSASVSVRKSRPIAVTAVAKAFMLSEALPMVGVDVAYHLTDRLALGAQLSSVLLAVDASVYGRYFLLAGPRNGMFVDLGLHGVAAIMSPGIWAPSAEIGYEARSTSGFTFSLSTGLMAGTEPRCVACPPGQPPGRWWAVPLVSLRLGKAF